MAKDGADNQALRPWGHFITYIIIIGVFINIHQHLDGFRHGKVFVLFPLSSVVSRCHLYSKGLVAFVPKGW